MTNFIRRLTMFLSMLILLAACGGTPINNGSAKTHNDLSGDAIAASSSSRAFEAGDMTTKAQPNATNPDNAAFSPSNKPCCPEPAPASKTCADPAVVQPLPGNTASNLGYATMFFPANATKFSFVGTVLDPDPAVEYTFSGDQVSISSAGTYTSVEAGDRYPGRTYTEAVAKNVSIPANGLGFMNHSGKAMNVAVTFYHPC